MYSYGDQLYRSLLLMALNVHSSIGLPLTGNNDLPDTASSKSETDFGTQMLAFVINTVSNVQVLSQRLYKRWQLFNCPNLDMAVYGDCLVKSQITLIALAIGSATLFVSLMCCLCRRLHEPRQRDYRPMKNETCSRSHYWWRLDQPLKSINTNEQKGHLSKCNWFKRRQKRRLREREDRLITEREKEIERRRRKEKKMKSKVKRSLQGSRSSSPPFTIIIRPRTRYK